MMASQTQHIEDEALALPAQSRLRLAERLLSSVAAGTASEVSEDEATELALRRAAEIDAGAVSALDYRQEMARIRSVLRRS